MANAYKNAFDSKKYQVAQAFDGEEAIDALLKTHPNLVILDLVLPLRDGFSVLEQLRADPEFKDTRVIIASNLGQQSDIDRGKQLGADDYIIKSETSIFDVMRKAEAFL